ncbi:MAG TPA: flippase-like domain-containing protein [Caulobacteraceae bacterium]|jgi:putative membrane protein|nr:flippase-like domain-containing protein [Caulobacteraceae bacterium]
MQPIRRSTVHRYRIRPRNAASVAFLLVGIAAFVWVLRENDYRAVFHIVTMMGAGLAIIVILRGFILAIGGLAWSSLLQTVSAASVPVMIGLRTIGEAINVLLPVGAVGGDVVRAMLLKSRGVDGGAAAASTLVDVLLQAAAQALFLLLGLVMSLRFAGAADLTLWAAGGVGVAALALGGFGVVQRFGGARLIEQGLVRMARRWQAATAAGAIRLDEPLQAIYADRRAVGAALSLHELGWLVSALETWTALRLMGVPISASGALVLESLSRAVRAAAFPVPSGLGVQEGGYIAVGAVLGIPSETALALSLVKRVPDLAIGLPGLLAWYLLQVRRLLPIGSAPRPPEEPFR